MPQVQSGPGAGRRRAVEAADPRRSPGPLWPPWMLPGGGQKSLPPPNGVPGALGRLGAGRHAGPATGGVVIGAVLASATHRFGRRRWAASGRNSIVRLSFGRIGQQAARARPGPARTCPACPCGTPGASRRSRPARAARRELHEAPLAQLGRLGTAGSRPRAATARSGRPVPAPSASDQLRQAVALAAPAAHLEARRPGRPGRPASPRPWRSSSARPRTVPPQAHIRADPEPRPCGPLAALASSFVRVRHRISPPVRPCSRLDRLRRPHACASRR